MEQERINEIGRTAKGLPEFMSQLRREGADAVQLADSMSKYLCMKARKETIPLCGQFELTPLCNLDCKMCYVHLNRDQLRGQQPLSADTWERIFHQAIENGMMFANLTGGECLTYPEFDRLYLYLYRAGVQISVLTNGLLLNETRIRFFQEYPPALVRVTLYGSSNDAYERVTGHRAFDAVIRNICLANEAKLPLALTLTPNKYSSDDDEALVRLASSLSIPFDINSDIMEPRTETGRNSCDHYFSYKHFFKLIKLKMLLSGRDVPSDVNSDLPPTGSENANRRYGLTCDAGKRSFSVNWHGSMMPCNRLSEFSTSLLEHDFGFAWKSLIQCVKGIPIPLECDGCAYKKLSGKCLAEHMPELKNGHVNSRVCEWCREYVRSGLVKLDE